MHTHHPCWGSVVGGGNAAAVGVVYGRRRKGVRGAKWGTPGSPGTPVAAVGGTNIVGTAQKVVSVRLRKVADVGGDPLREHPGPQDYQPQRRRSQR